MTVKWLLAIPVAAVCIIASCNKGDDPNALSPVDSDFLIKANSILVNQLHVGSYIDSNVTYYNGQALNGIKIYGMQFNDSHRTDQHSADSLAARFSITLNYEPDEAHKQVRQQLGVTAGRTFDSLYVNNLAADHAILVSLCQKEANLGLNHDIKHFATLFLVNEVWHRNTLIYGLQQQLNL
jgi:hypothetical protein